MSPPNKAVRGIRDSIAAGYMLGRVSGGRGDVQLVPLSELSKHILYGGLPAQTSIQTIMGQLRNSAVPAGGTTSQVLTKNSSTDYDMSWKTSSGSGTVTSVAMTVPSILSVSGSPITTSGTLAVSLANQNANLVFAGPSTGAAATPAFRSLVANDIPDLSAAYDVAGAASTAQANAEAYTDSTAQPVDADLTAIAALSGTGILVRTASNTWALRSIAAGTNVTVTDGDGVSGNPTVAASSGGGGGALPMVNGDTPGPSAIADPEGQFIAAGATTAGRSITNYLGVGLATDLPADPNVGSGCCAIYMESDTGTTKIWNGSSWA